MDDLNAFTPEAGDEKHRLLIDQLRRMFDTHAEDVELLAHARVRLMQKDALPHPRPVPIMQTLPESSNRLREGKRNMQFIHAAIYERRSWQQRLATIAAVFFIVILVGSLAVILLHRQQGNIANAPPLRVGWTQAVYLSGSGNQTFTHLHIALSTLWGESDGCTGNGNLDIHLQLRGVDYEGGGSCPRLTPPSPLFGPDQINLESTAQILDIITVRAPGSINWFLQLSNSTVKPVLDLNQFTAPHSDWTSVGGVGGGYAYDANGFTKSAGTIDLARSIPSFILSGSSVALETLAFVPICIGNGGMTIQVTPPASGATIEAPACDGQPLVSIARFATTPDTQKVIVMGDKGVIWQLYIYACTNAKGCN